MQRNIRRLMLAVLSLTLIPAGPASGWYRFFWYRQNQTHLLQQLSIFKAQKMMV